jgi:hypothetical protein
MAVASIAAGALCGACNLVIVADPLWAYVGLVQRLFEGGVLGWIVFVAMCIRGEAAAQPREQGPGMDMLQPRPSRRAGLCADAQNPIRRSTPVPPLRRAA